jgi:hypothetical protein
MVLLMPANRKDFRGNFWRLSLALPHVFIGLDAMILMSTRKPTHMDYLDPSKERAQTIRLIIGYILIGVAILIATLILLYQAYGFGINKEGQVIQSGLVFMSSQPSNAEIYLNGKIYRNSTNTKLQLPAGQYTAELRRSGYSEWQRIITVEGGSVQHFDYPKLFPVSLKTENIRTYAEAPGLATQSPDRHWLLVQETASPLNFDLYDLSDNKNVNKNASLINLPESVLTNPREGAQSIKLAEWSTDNRHVMLLHTYTANNTTASEYIMLDRQDPAASINLTRTLLLSPAKQLQLWDKKPNQFYVYDTESHTLGTTTIEAAGTVSPLLDQVIAFKPYGRNMVLYITDKAAPAGQVLSMLYDNGTIYKIREHGPTAPFLIDMAQYNGDWFVAAGASADNKVYVYKNPQRLRKSSSTAVLVPVQIMRLTAPNKLQFSTNTEHIMIENAANFVDYDAETDKGYHFTSKYSLDPPAPYASWMDGQRLTYVSGGKVAVFDYDNINGRILSPASPNYLPFFDRDYKNLYTLVPAANGSLVLTSSSMLTPEDQ